MIREKSEPSGTYPQLVMGLLEGTWPAGEAEAMTYLQQHGFTPEPGTRTCSGSQCHGEMATPFPYVTGHWTVTEGTLESVSLFPVQTSPTDRAILRDQFDLLAIELTDVLGNPTTESGMFSAPQSAWYSADATVSLDCHWASERTGLIQLAIERSHQLAQRATR